MLLTHKYAFFVASSTNPPIDDTASVLIIVRNDGRFGCIADDPAGKSCHWSSYVDYTGRAKILNQIKNKESIPEYLISDKEKGFAAINTREVEDKLAEDLKNKGYTENTHWFLYAKKYIDNNLNKIFS